MEALKFVDATDTELILEGPIALYGGRDLTHEYFYAGTQFESSYTRTGRLMVDWEHGFKPDADPKTGAPIPQPGRDDVLGFVDWTTARNDDIGLLARYVLDRRDRYVREFIQPLAKAGLIGASSEAVPDRVVKSKDGRIEIWPLKRQSLTVEPCEPRMLTDYQVQVLKSLSDANPALKALLPQAAGEAAVDASDGEAADETYNHIQLRARAVLALAEGE